MTLQLAAASVVLPALQLVMKLVAVMARLLGELLEEQLEWLSTQRTAQITIPHHRNQNTDTVQNIKNTKNIRTTTIVHRVRGKRAAADLNVINSL